MRLFCRSLVAGGDLFAKTAPAAGAGRWWRGG